MATPKKRRYWIVNNDKPDAVKAVEKMVKASKEGADIVVLTDSEYRWLHNQEACQFITEEIE